MYTFFFSFSFSVIYISVYSFVEVKMYISIYIYFMIGSYKNSKYGYRFHVLQISFSVMRSWPVRRGRSVRRCRMV